MESGAQIVLSGIQLVLAGLGIGLLMAAPLGPVNVLVIQRAVSRGFWGGLAAGLGAVLGDGVLAAIGAFSIAAISDVIVAYSDTVQLVGGLLLLGFGLALLLCRPVLLTPVAEELFFRGFTLTVLGRRSIVIGVIGSCALFGLYHFNGSLGSIINPLPFGLATAFSVIATRSVYPAIVAHMLWNLSALISDVGPTRLRRSG